MPHNQVNAVPKVHPASREILPDDPLEMTGFELPGNPDLMLRLLVEDFARLGWGTEMILQMARDPNYQAFYGLYQLFGEEALRRRVAGILSRCGVMRVKTKETQPLSENLVQISVDVPETTKGLSQNRRGLAHFAESSEQNVPVPLSADGGIGSQPVFQIPADNVEFRYSNLASARQEEGLPCLPCTTGKSAAR